MFLDYVGGCAEDVRYFNYKNSIPFSCLAWFEVQLVMLFYANYSLQTVWTSRPTAATLTDCPEPPCRR